MRKLISILLVLVISTALLLIPAQAVTMRIMYQNYDVSGTTLSCYGVPMPMDGDLSVSVGSTKLSSSITTISEAQVPVTVYFLVDASTSLSEATIKQQTDILTVISSHMGEEDTMVITTIDDTFFEGPLLTKKEDRDSAIETIGRKNNWQTNLHMGIDKAVDSLITSTAFNTNRYLVILSDGHDDNREEVALENLTAKVAAANVPIFNLILGPANGGANTQDMEYLTKVDEAALGGYICRLATDNVSAAEAAENVWNTIQNNTVIRFDGATLDTSADVEVLIRYEYKTDRYEDTLLLRAVDLQKRLIIPIMPATPSTDSTALPDAKDNSTTIILFAGGGVLLLALIALIVFLVLKPKKSQSTPSSAEGGMGEGSGSFIDTSDSYSGNYSSYGGGGDVGASSFAPSGSTMPVGNGFMDFSGGSSTMPVGGAIRVSLVALMHPEISCEFTLGEGAETTMGRDSRSTIVLNGSDRKLSGVHAGILWDGTHLLIRDKKSTNGTSINGSPCAGDTWYLLENGATLKAGNYEYRVSYQNNTPAM